VTALDRATGTRLWSYELGDAPRCVHVEGDRIYVLDGHGRIHCLHATSGTPVGKIDLRLKNANALLWDGETFFVTSDDEVVALDRDGVVRWRERVPTNGAWGLGGLVVESRVVQPDFSRD